MALQFAALSCTLFPSFLPSFHIHVLLLLSSQPEGAPDFVTPVSASQPVPLTPGLIHHARLLTTRKDAMKKHPQTFRCLQRKDYRTVTSGWQGAPYFRIYTAGSCFKTGDFVKTKLGGGATVERLRHDFLWSLRLQTFASEHIAPAARATYNHRSINRRCKSYHS